jgi:hypothetical protein
MNDMGHLSGCHITDSDMAPGLIVRRRNWGEGVVVHVSLMTTDD